MTIQTQCHVNLVALHEGTDVGDNDVYWIHVSGRTYTLLLRLRGRKEEIISNRPSLSLQSPCLYNMNFKLIHLAHFVFDGRRKIFPIF